MLLVISVSIFVAGAVGFLIKWLLEVVDSQFRISWREYGIGMACAPVLAILTSYIGWSLARSNNMTFSEYWNGWEVTARKLSIPCSRDGPCEWDYDCDPYIVMVSYSCMCDNKGNCSTCYRPETRYHSCPYVDTEYNYSVTTTVGDFSIAEHVFPENPQSHRWRRGESIPSSIIMSAGVGDPPFWVSAKQRCEANAPGPVSIKRDYNNYILASEHTLMKQYSSDIGDYRKKGLLPDLPKDTYSFYSANKIRFVGFSPPDANNWAKALEYLNAALGNQLNGDLLLVLVENPEVSQNPDRYSLALKAFWQDKTTYQHNALAKNEIVVILGTEDGKTISWSRGFTAMPIGNEKLTTILRDGLKGRPLDWGQIIGPIESRRDGNGVSYPPPGLSAAALPDLLWGWNDRSTKFSRVSMSGKDGRGGFLYLKGEIQPTSGQTWWIGAVTLLVCSCMWLWAALHYDPSENRIKFGSSRF